MSCEHMSIWVRFLNEHISVDGYDPQVCNEMLGYVKGYERLQI